MSEREWQQECGFISIMCRDEGRRRRRSEVKEGDRKISSREFEEKENV